MSYFPDSFMKRTPPVEYFWRVYSTLMPENFHKKYNTQLDRLMARIQHPARLKILEEHRIILLQRKEDNLKLSLSLRKTGVAKNLIYLKKVKRPIKKVAPLDVFLQGGQKNDTNIRKEEQQIFKDY